MFVAPIVENETSRWIIFPGGNNWVDYWDNKTTYSGYSIHEYDAPLDKIPIVF